MQKKNPQSFYLEAKKSLGQNFLKDANIIDKIVEKINETALLNQCQSIHEIGPGSGAITRPLLEKNFHVSAIEKDERALMGLKGTLQKEYPTQLKLYESDILKFAPQEILRKSAFIHKPLCFGNIPYYITSEILFWLCRNKDVYACSIFMVQNEVAERLIAKARTKDYSRLSIKMQLNFQIEKLLFIPAHCFVPAPKVDSAIIRLIPNDFSFPSKEDEVKFESFCAMLFSARRKMLRRVLHLELANMSDAKSQRFWQQCEKQQIFPDTRPDAIPPKDVLALYFILQQICQNH